MRSLLFVGCGCACCCGLIRLIPLIILVLKKKIMSSLFLVILFSLVRLLEVDLSYF